MIRHQKYTPTRYEYAIEDKNGNRAFTLWFMQRKPTLNKIYRTVVVNLDAIKTATKSNDIKWNGDGTITAGDFIGHMTDSTLLQARGYSHAGIVEY